MMKLGMKNYSCTWLIPNYTVTIVDYNLASSLLKGLQCVTRVVICVSSLQIWKKTQLIPSSPQTCTLYLLVALIAVCIRMKLKGSDYQQWFPNYDDI